MSTAGDLGRRVTERRAELGLTLEEVASRAGMSTTYLRALETSPSPDLPRAALWRLAAALETSVDLITGSGMDQPPGRAEPSDRPLLESLSVDECRALVAPGGVGRVVFSNDRGPVALPVNFRMLADNVVFRTESDSDLLSILPNGEISFEVDHLDGALTEGWSVLLSGHGRTIVDQSEYEQVASLGITPWAAGKRDTYVVLAPTQVTGRRIRRRSGHG
jgi:nitroimidazol reductase NimA-like FMN-containing flavoprotein (pyridoxamine 5'-phosphate oxidase superfamily)